MRSRARASTRMPVPENAFGAEITRHIQRRSLSGAIYCQEKPATSADTRPSKMSGFGSGGMELVGKGFKSILNMRMC